ncbi:putative rhodanese [Magnetofaba australis IT-1]|uniref:Putative rhodanese n=2 Tax=Magnetofaba TaxID=1472292 RepID=A0A1Y2K2W7_9PROT|nr:putative rhodanese [Magnetofaba australis IT-1]
MYMEIVASVEGVPGMLPSPDMLHPTLSRLGITPETLVVAYDATGGLDAARFLWTLACMGHEKFVTLDGGLGAWYQEQRPMDGEAPKEAPGMFSSSPTGRYYAEMEDVRAIADGEAEGFLIDTRSDNEYLGQTLGPVRGHVAGAVHMDWISNLKGPQNPYIQDDESLKARFAAIGLSDTATPVTVYCHTAHRAAHTWLLLRHLGFDNVKLYDGSMAEWGMRRQPTVRGAEPR